MGAPASGSSGGSSSLGRRIRSQDVLTAGFFAFIALYVTGLLWIDPFNRVHVPNAFDQEFFHWVIAHAAHAVTHGENPMFATEMNVPGGVNLMANTSILAFAIPLTPITLLFGPSVTYLVILTFGFMATATAWYWFFSRHLVTRWLPAFLGGALCGFGPGMLSQGNGHPNLIAQFLVPFIVWRVLKLREGRYVRDGIILGLLVVWQAFTNEEVLLLTVIGIGLFMLAMAVRSDKETRKAWARPLLSGLGVTALVATALLAYPLWFQFFGPQHYRGLPRGIELYSTDIASYTAFGHSSLLGDIRESARLAPNGAEENTFFGWPLVLGLLAAITWLWRERLVPALTFTMLAFAFMSLGPRVISFGQNTSIPGPWLVLGKLPLLDTVVPVRIGLFVLPVVGIIAALGIDRLLAATSRSEAETAENPESSESGKNAERTPTRTVRRRFVLVALGLALIPLLPVPLRVSERPIPDFITSGAWKSYLSPGQSMVTLPLASTTDTTALRWSASTNIGFPIASGYFLGPGGRDGASLFGPPPRPTATLFNQVMRTRKPIVVGDRERAIAREDLEFWQAGAIVMGPKGNRELDDAMLDTATDLFGAPEEVEGVWVWKVEEILKLQ
ncbi:MAG: hypothetical protein H0T78_04430 [Longispora sp.]|nr:hypothetical protein [Longispora sp. (in: high G+C Gram-positive bacteria)]